MAEFLWFIGGALTYKALSKLLRISHTVHLIREIQLNVIKFLASAVQDVAFIHSLKYKLMTDAEFSEDYVLNEKKSDEKDYIFWKNDVVKRLYSSVSPSIAIHISSKDWRELVDVLDKYYNKNET